MHHKIWLRVALLSAVAFLSACASTKEPAPAEPTTPAAATPDTAASTSGAQAGSSAAASTSDAAPTVQSTAPALHPLDDPNSALAARTVYFDFDRSEVLADFQALLKAHGQYLSANASASVTLEGHADERGTREYNIGLGHRRADAVLNVLKLQGARAGQIKTVSYGEERPAAEGHDESAWRLNRRVEIVYTSR